MSKITALLLQVTYMHECNNDFQASLAASLYSCLIITGRFDAGICVACAMFSGDRGNQDIYLSPSHSHTGPTQHLSLAAKPRNYTEFHPFRKWMASLRSQKRPDYKQSSHSVPCMILAAD